MLDEMASRKRTVDTSSDSTLRRLNDALAQTRETLAERSFEPPSQSGSDRVTLDGLRARRDSLERELARKSSTFRRDLIRTRAGLDDVLRTLAPDEALVSYACYLEFPTAERRAPHARRWTAEAERLAPRPMVLAFVLRPSQGAPRVVRIARAEEVDARVAAWRAALPAQMSAEDDSLANAGLNVSGDSLRKLVWDPVAATVRTARRVFVVLDGSLQLMSMEALPLDPLARRYVIEDSSVLNYLSAERDLMRRMEPGPRAIWSRSVSDTSRARIRQHPAALRVLAPRRPAGISRRRTCPIFPEAREKFATSRACGAARTRRARRSASVRCSPARTPRKPTSRSRRRSHRCSTSPRTASSCSARSSSHPDAPTRPSRGQDLAPPPMEWSTPCCSPVSFSPRRRGGIARGADVLTAEEVGSLDLSRADIVVLSGCETGAGLVESREGLLGLRRAFSVAGVGSMLVSLWPVQDVSTEAFMRGLYADRPGRPMDLAESTHQGSSCNSSRSFAVWASGTSRRAGRKLRRRRSPRPGQL
ncbi:MAG: CHAT domain-containing protein [Candidatus Eisenbacteria bacterium]|nr:CHAT domain-containing protein [Candidatus Eisenbacteria bacterium]